MDHFKTIAKKVGVDVGYHGENLHPDDGEGRVGKAGFDKNLTFPEMMEMAYKMEGRPNIIIKGGPNAKWYIKKFDPAVIPEEIEKQKWRDSKNAEMYIVELE